MSKKSVQLFCFDCDVEFTIKYSEENTKMTPIYCPFCGQEIDPEDSDSDSDEETSDVEVEDEWSLRPSISPSGRYV